MKSKACAVHGGEVGGIRQAPPQDMEAAPSSPCAVLLRVEVGIVPLVFGSREESDVVPDRQPTGIDVQLGQQALVPCLAQAAPQGCQSDACRPHAARQHPPEDIFGLACQAPDRAALQQARVVHVSRRVPRLFHLVEDLARSHVVPLLGIGVHQGTIGSTMRLETSGVHLLEPAQRRLRVSRPGRCCNEGPEVYLRRLDAGLLHLLEPLLRGRQVALVLGGVHERAVRHKVRLQLRLQHPREPTLRDLQLASVSGRTHHRGVGHAVQNQAGRLHSGDPLFHGRHVPPNRRGRDDGRVRDRVGLLDLEEPLLSGLQVARLRRGRDHLAIRADIAHTLGVQLPEALLRTLQVAAP
mmetsp:Transcript_105560/g.315298  ORF Transcript_105560/g.315298 Transcript_105560/m.315298 type:complete len:353 (-) Transcript_105560:119-1177(-)